jgi:undecaprenyl-diphosphatase
MGYSYLAAVAFIQGITEFLPVSSSAHLVLLPALSGSSDQGIFTDVCAHLGSLLAVVVFYRARIVEVLCGRNRALFARLCVSFMPILILGIAKLALGFDIPRGVGIIAWASIIFGVFLWLGDRRAPRTKEISLLDSLIAGVAQAMAVIPGVSRSGITLTSLRMGGIARPKALEFAFLMGVPAIAAAGVEAFIEAGKSSSAIDWSGVAFVVAASFGFSFASIKIMTGWVRGHSLAPFAAYRIALGAAILLFA